MQPDELRALQAPLKERYQQDPAQARVTMTARGDVSSPNVTCRVETARGSAEAGLHPAAGGDGLSLCSGDMLLEALVACAGVTLRAVATALDIPLRGGSITAQGEMDFRGTLAVSKEAAVGLDKIHLQFDLDTDATPEQQASLIKLTERFCVVLQTLKHSPELTVSSTVCPAGD